MDLDIIVKLHDTSLLLFIFILASIFFTKAVDIDPPEWVQIIASFLIIILVIAYFILSLTRIWH